MNCDIIIIDLSDSFMKRKVIHTLERGTRVLFLEEILTSGRVIC
jgi:hypothetical protein